MQPARCTQWLSSGSLVQILINAPWVFKTIWMMMSPLLGARTQQKIQVFGESGFQERLRELIPPQHLPRFLGGEDDDVCPSGTGPWSDPAFNPRLQTFMGRAQTSADLTEQMPGSAAAAAAAAQQQQRARPKTSHR